MKNLFETVRTTLALASTIFIAFAGQAGAQTAAKASAPDTSGVEIRGGTAAFDVGTNLSAISVHGKSNALTARLRLRQTPDGPVLEAIEADVPVKSLNTGMGIRDDHMRKHVFTTEDGQLPDLRFTADRATCSKTAAHQSTCDLAGTLSIRGTARPFTIPMKLTEEGETIHAVGDGIVTLSAYGIERPSQLGVTTADAVKLRFDLTAKVAGSRAVATSGVK
jgi:polyisoprenoid-binding protein YceI